MSFDWSQYLDVSRELAEQAKNAPNPLQEARYRASISRAYYAVFGRARTYLKRHDHIPEPSILTGSNGERINIHRYVREKFLSRNDQDYQEIAASLERISLYRNIADYDLNHTALNNLPFTTQATLKWAKEALATLQAMQNR
ncbi:MAG TPA: hypothetical protein VNG51_19035 [Ktedonobacteraceae bacterium]|nr:hypothetical protein [Ktedonobacteraceae bacterium]